MEFVKYFFSINNLNKKALKYESRNIKIPFLWLLQANAIEL